MPFIIGCARNEDELYERYVHFVAGVAGQYKVEFTGSGNGSLLDVHVQEGFEYETFTLTCIAESPDGGHFSVTGSESGNLPPASCSEVYYYRQLQFYLDYGTSDFKLGDQFTITCRSASDRSKPDFSYVQPHNMGTTTVSLTCTTAGSDSQGATFAVRSSTGETLDPYQQGTDYVSDYVNFHIPLTGPHFGVNDALTFHLTENPLRAAGLHWHYTLLERFPSPDTGFGESLRNMDKVGAFSRPDGSVSFLIHREHGVTDSNNVVDSTSRDSWGAGLPFNYWGLSYLTEVDTSVDWKKQPGLIFDKEHDSRPSGVSDNQRPIHHLWTGGEIPYWIFASGRRVIMATRSGIYYHQSYLGLYYTYTSDSQHPTPLMAGGSGVTGARVIDPSDKDFTIPNAFWNPIQAGGQPHFSPLRVYNPEDGSGAVIENYESSPSAGAGYRGFLRDSRTARDLEVFPYAKRSLLHLRHNLDGSIPVFKVTIAPITGVMEGVYAVAARDSLQPETILDMNGTRLITFCSGHRTDYQGFVAMEMA